MFKKVLLVATLVVGGIVGTLALPDAAEANQRRWYRGGGGYYGYGYRPYYGYRNYRPYYGYRSYYRPYYGGYYGRGYYGGYPYGGGFYGRGVYVGGGGISIGF